jgi:hypothetical protein
MSEYEELEEDENIPEFKSYEEFKAASPEGARLVDMMGFTGIAKDPGSLFGKLPSGNLGSSPELDAIKTDESNLLKEISSLKSNISGNIGNVSGITSITDKIKENVGKAAAVPKEPERKLQPDISNLMKLISSFPPATGDQAANLEVGDDFGESGEQLTDADVPSFGSVEEFRAASPGGAAITDALGLTTALEKGPEGFGFGVPNSATTPSFGPAGDGAEATFQDIKAKFGKTNVEKIVYEAIANPKFKVEKDVPARYIEDDEDLGEAQPKKVPTADPKKLKEPDPSPPVPKPSFAPFAKFINPSALGNLKALAGGSKKKISDVTRNVKAAKLIQGQETKRIGENFRKMVENPKPDSKATTFIPRAGTKFSGLQALGDSGFMNSMKSDKANLGTMLGGSMQNLNVDKLVKFGDDLEKNYGMPLTPEEKARIEAENDEEERRLAAENAGYDGNDDPDVPVVEGTPEEQEAARQQAAQILKGFGFNPSQFGG